MFIVKIKIALLCRTLFNGGAEGSRTLYLLGANEAL